MAKIIPFKRRPPSQKKKAPPLSQIAQTDSKSAWKESLGDLMRELLRANVDWEKIAENSSVAEIYEVENHLHLRISLPEKKKENLRLSLSPNLVRLKVVEEERESTLHSIPLPYSVVESTAEAHYENGFLEISLEKKSEEPIEEHLIKIT